jgi:hypothetical protein
MMRAVGRILAAALLAIGRQGFAIAAARAGRGARTSAKGRPRARKPDEQWYY